MRIGVVAGMLAVVAGVTFADPVPDERFLGMTRHKDAALRLEGAKGLAGRLSLDRGRTQELVAVAVLTNDKAVRSILVDAMIAEKLIDRPTAAHVPTAAVLDQRLHQLLPKEPEQLIPNHEQCRVTGGTARGATIECRVSQCPGACRHVTRTYAITTGVRWKLELTQARDIDDGSCGDCMLLE